MAISEVVFANVINISLFLPQPLVVVKKTMGVKFLGFSINSIFFHDFLY